jgi:integrase
VPGVPARTSHHGCVVSAPTEVQVAIFEASARGATPQELSEEHGVSPERIRQIIRQVRDYRRDAGPRELVAAAPAEPGRPSVRNLAIYHAFGSSATVEELAEQHELTIAQVQGVIRSVQAWYGDVGVRSFVPAARVVGMRERVGTPPPGSAQHALDTYLPPDAQDLVLRGKARKTIAAYKMGVGWWVDWARDAHVTVFPAPQNAMIRMLRDWERRPVHVGCQGGKQANGQKCDGHRPSPSAVWVWYSGMKWIHGLGDPPMDWQGGSMLTDAISGYIRQMKDDGWRPTKAPRAYKAQVAAMLDAIDRAPEVIDSRWGLMPGRKDFLRALVAMCWYTGGRASDLARYRIDDVSYFPRGIQLTLAKSKSHQDKRTEEYRTIFRDVDRPQYDGVLAVERLIARLREDGVTSGALLRPWHKSGVLVRGGRADPDALAYQMDITCLSRNLRLVAMLAYATDDDSEPCGENCPCGMWPRPPHIRNWQKFTIHSTRRGRLQQLLEEGADIWEVEEELGWAHGGASKEYRAEVNRQMETAANALGML